MARMVMIFKTPSDPQAFDKHYFGIHVPLAKQLPGLRKYEVSQGPILTRTEQSDQYLVATLHFDDLDSIRNAFASEIGKACAEDRRALASDSDAQMLLFEIREV